MKTFDEISATTLMRCLMRVRPLTAPGIDGVTRDEFRLAGGCSILARDLADGTYAPLPSRRAWLPKPNGDLRPIAVPAIRDRVAQRAVSEVLSRKYEPRFSDVSFGFRPGRRANQAVRRVMHAIEATPSAIVIEFDIAGFFDRVRHGDVLDRLVADGVETRIVDLVRTFLRAPIVDGSTITSPTFGTPQGGPLSPILANLVLDAALDAWFPTASAAREWGAATLVRFADDFVIVVGDDAVAADVLTQVEQRLAAFGLVLNDDKTGKVHLHGPRAGERGGSITFLGWTIRFEEHAHGRRLVRRTSLKTMKRTLQRLRQEMRSARWLAKTASERHDWFLAVVRGHREYFLVAGNEDSVRYFEDQLEGLLARSSHSDQASPLAHATP